MTDQNNEPTFDPSALRRWIGDALHPAAPDAEASLEPPNDWTPAEDAGLQELMGADYASLSPEDLIAHQIAFRQSQPEQGQPSPAGETFDAPVPTGPDGQPADMDEAAWRKWAATCPEGEWREAVAAFGRRQGMSPAELAEHAAGYRQDAGRPEILTGGGSSDPLWRRSGGGLVTREGLEAALRRNGGR